MPPKHGTEGAGWLEAKEVAVWDGGGKKVSQATRAKAPKTLREAGASPGGEEGEEGGRRGLCVIRDEWQAYQNALPQLRYRHFTVNLSVSFVNAETEAQSTASTSEGHGGQIKKQYGKLGEQLLRDHLDAIEGNAWLGEKHGHGPLGRLLHDMILKYRLE